MGVSRADLEGWLHRLGDLPTDPAAGVFGPGSAMWEFGRESISFLAGGRAALLQLAHPWVAQAVRDHSVAADDLAGRFKRTFDHVFALIFGARDDALGTARRIHQMHGQVTGTLRESVGVHRAGAPYAANHQPALLWVHATLLESTVTAREHVLGPMSTSQTARLYADSMRFARLFGIGDRVLPQDWPAFARYWRGMLASDTLVVSADAAAMARFLLTPPTPRMGPAWRWYRVMTTGLLPERLRRAFGLPWERRHRLLYATSIRSMRRLYPRLPARLRYLPAYQDAQRRLAGDDRQGLLGRVADRVITEALRQPQRARP